jgi:surfeit locus 1 family protein
MASLDTNKDGASQAPSSKPRSFIVFRGFLLFAALVFVALGSWQVQRLFWKLDLIARVDARVHAAPTAPPSDAEWASADLSSFEYRHVTAKGVFDHAKQAFVQAVTELGPGFWVVTPLTLDDGRVVLVNRGYVPGDKRDAVAPKEQPTSPVSVTGLLRLSEPGGAFLRSNDPKADRWFSRDVEVLASARGIGAHAPYFIDADATPNPGGYPVGGLTVVQFRNSHLTYALTWFALAAMAIGALIWLRRGRSLD